LCRGDLRSHFRPLGGLFRPGRSRRRLHIILAPGASIILAAAYVSATQLVATLLPKLGRRKLRPRGRISGHRSRFHRFGGRMRSRRISGLAACGGCEYIFALGEYEYSPPHAAAMRRGRLCGPCGGPGGTCGVPCRRKYGRGGPIRFADWRHMLCMCRPPRPGGSAVSLSYTDH